jgi:hypothetical protein
MTADVPQRSYRSLHMCRGVIPSTIAASAQLSCPAIALVIISRRVIARASRRTRRSILSIARLYSIMFMPRTSPTFMTEVFS